MMYVLREQLNPPARKETGILAVCKQLGIVPGGDIVYRPGTPREEMRLCERIKRDAETFRTVDRSMPDYDSIHNSLQAGISELLLIRMTSAYSSR